MAFFNQINILTAKTSLIATTFVALSTGSAQALSVGTSPALSVDTSPALSVGTSQAFGLGTYKLENHPDGGATESYGGYGLRLDGLLDRDPNKTYVFDFEAEGAHMFLNYNGSEVRIYGTAYNQEYDNFWSVDFTYLDVTKKEDGLIVKSAPQSLGNAMGSINSIDGSQAYDFDVVDFSGEHNYTFQIAQDHRGIGDYSGFGWLNHGTTDAELAIHMYHSDWLFKVGEPVKVPESGSAVSLLALGVLITGAVSRNNRNRQQ